MGGGGGGSDKDETFLRLVLNHSLLIHDVVLLCCHYIIHFHVTFRPQFSWFIYYL